MPFSGGPPLPRPMADLIEAAAALVAFLFALGSLGASLYLIVGARRWRRSVDDRLARAEAPFAPPATLIVPTRGEFAALEANLRAIAALSYRDLETIFAVDSRDDPLFA